MKNYAIALLCLLTVGATLNAGGDGGNIEPYYEWFGDSSCYPQETHHRSFMLTRGLPNNLSIKNDWWLNILYGKKGSMLAGAQCIAAYQQSFQQDSTARYFLFNDKNRLLVSGSGNTADQNYRDIMAEWIGLGPLTAVDPDNPPQNLSDFRGYFTINPLQKQASFMFEFKKSVRDIIDFEFFEDMWVDIFAPVLIVSNDINVRQWDVKPNTEPQPSNLPRNILEAFVQPAWAFGKIGCGEQSVIRLSELQIRFGKAFLFEEHFIVGYYSILSFPTGNRQDAKYMFQPVSGNNGHFGFGTGVNFQIVLNRDISRYAVCLFADLEGLFLMHNVQWRTVDLRDKPWSRYLQFVRNDSPPNATIPGVNVLTWQFQVHPYNLADFSAGFRIYAEPVEFEIGYNIWGHAAERLYFAVPFREDLYGIASGGMATPEGTAATASESTIKTLAPWDTDCDGNPTFVSIKAGNLDLLSGASQSTLNQKIHASITYTHIGKRMDGFMNLGAQYDVPYRNTALTTAAVWVKCGAAF